MTKILELTVAKLVRMPIHDEQQIATDPLIGFYDKTFTFFNNHQPGKLAKDLYKLIFALMEHQANNEQAVNFASSLYDIKQLLQLLEVADPMQQTGELFNQSILDSATEFMHENSPTNLSCNLCRILLEFMRYELQIGYPSFINEFLPAVMALLEWLNAGACLMKAKPVIEEI
ncbi:hypothetical protein A3860_02135 [Niastella vici]|uniref:Uncharacterized protein n=1 Tax=Niastella vici TaxID=1703345 RepID=A0A1V9G9B9_9BACT|nr:hypothetical protein [Niastella vici]OQP67182.1 hypothetical protein A3860_02135 [Niastella vici]